MLIIGLAVVAGAFVLEYLCVVGFRRWGAERLLDIPNVRSSHTRPTPRGGGLGIVIGVLLGAWCLFFYRIPGIPLREIAAISLGGGIVALTGWLDDIHRLPYRVRLAVQTISSVVVIVAIGYFPIVTTPFIGDIRLNSMGILVAFLWMMGLTNAFNFMDGIDGIAGGQAVIAGIGWAIIGSMSSQSLISLLGLLLAASSLGFLFHNWPPAKIFMGDVGSAFIGFTLAVLPVIAAQTDTRSVVVGFLMVWPFIIDASFTLIRRLIKRENIFAAHRSHIYQRLVIAGYSHRFVTLVYMGLAMVGAIIALLWYKKAPFVNIAVVFLPILLFVALWRFTVVAESHAQFGA